jgi:hypothetical protein
VPGASSPITVGGLTNGQAYTFTVTATNAIGTSVASAPSSSVTPRTVPGAPTSVVATAGNTQATVSFVAPADGGATITDYAVTSSPGNITVHGTTTPIIVAGLTNGQAYTFTVVATNVAGPGAASSPSNSIMPTSAPTVPGFPAITTVAPGNGAATVSFTPPASNGGSAITSYTVTSSPGNLSATGTTSPILVTGLTNGQTYTFTVTATNAIGIGPASSASAPVIPALAPRGAEPGPPPAAPRPAAPDFVAPAGPRPRLPGR